MKNDFEDDTEVMSNVVVISEKAGIKNLFVVQCVHAVGSTVERKYRFTVHSIS